MFNVKLLRVGEVAEILRVSPMTVIRWCDSGHLPCIKVGSSRRIRESDLDYILQSERGPQPRKEAEKRPVYIGPPAEECGFYCDSDEEARQKELKRLCEETKKQIESGKVSDFAELFNKYKSSI
jgi:excisionase family DNA binding protein